MTTNARRDPELIDAPERQLLMVNGRGDPNKSPDFQAAVSVLFAVSYGLRFLLKRELGVDHKVQPLEALWDVEGGDFSAEDRSNWVWTAMIEQPEEVTSAMAEALARSKGIQAPPRLERFVEGRVAQILHVGPFADEPATVKRLHAFIAERGLRATGRHHEIYLNDVSRTAPERLRTILRQPVSV
jgi:hypothetical protein